MVTYQKIKALRNIETGLYLFPDQWPNWEIKQESASYIGYSAICEMRNKQNGEIGIFQAFGIPPAPKVGYMDIC